MKDTTIAVGLAKNVFEIAISREAGKVLTSSHQHLMTEAPHRMGWDGVALVRSSFSRWSRVFEGRH